MSIQQCPNCNMRVIPQADGVCPSCRQPVDPNAAPGHSEPSEQATSPNGATAPAESSPPSVYAGLAAKIRPQGSASYAEHIATPPMVTISRVQEDVFKRGLFLHALNVVRAAINSCDFAVYIDNQLVTKLSEGNRFETELSPGQHCIRVSAPLAHSRTITFNVEHGERVRFACSARTFGMLLTKLD